MGKNKLDINQLQHLLRQKSVFSIREVEYALLETDGKLSVLRKAIYNPPTNQDLNRFPKNEKLPFTLITDGEVIWNNLKELGQDEDWLENELRKLGIHSYKDVLFFDWRENDGAHVQHMQA